LRLDFLGFFPSPIDRRSPCPKRFECASLPWDLFSRCFALIKDGWKPYGVAGDSMMFRKKTTRLTAFISAAPAQGGKTMAQFSTELLSTEIPLFPGATGAQFSDNPAQLFFDSGKSMDDVVEFYKRTLAESGWKPTTDSLIKVSIYDVMIFRNPSGDMMRLQLHNFDDQARALIRYSTADQVAELEALADEQAKQRMEQAPDADDANVLQVDIPADAKDVEIERDSIEFQLAAGRARKIVEGWQREYVEAGWKEQTSVLQNVAGTILLTNGSKTVTIVYTDVGFMPAEVTIDATGIRLQRAAK
jgi:hypothetical protein